MTISTILISSILILLVFTVLGWILFSLRRRYADRLRKSIEAEKVFSAQKKLDLLKIFVPIEAIRENELIKSHNEEYRKANKNRASIRRAIYKNLRERGYSIDQEMEYFAQIPDILELKNIFSLRDIIKDIEYLYKRYEEYDEVVSRENGWIEDIVPRVIRKIHREESLDKLMEVLENLTTVEEAKEKLRDFFLSAEGKELVDKYTDEAVVESCNDILREKN